MSIIKLYKRLCPRHKIELGDKGKFADYDSDNCERCKELSNIRSLSEAKRLSCMKKDFKLVEEFQQFKMEERNKIDADVDPKYTESDIEKAVRDSFLTARVEVQLEVTRAINTLARELTDAQKQDSHQRDLVEKLRFTICELEVLKQTLGDILRECVSRKGMEPHK